ncbi:MAG: hypothetical protein LBL04_08520 [Bacteroidales bacterium]|nr:hypothetical protein [Bacteroidales bacterium]
MKISRIHTATLLLSMMSAIAVHSQNPVKYKVTFPDVGNYRVLKCEFHTHTVFSDGKVWPTERIMEAYNDDLDAISLTEHLEFRSHISELATPDHNHSFELAEPVARKLDILNIKGCEITRMVPPGHLNAIFVSDCNKILIPSGNRNPVDSANYRLAVKEAVSQGGFVFFNHPYYRLSHDNIRLPESIEKLMDAGLINGIELINENRYIPQSFDWALEKNLTMIASGDAHSSMPLFLREFGLKYRPMTLVLAEKRTGESILDALQNRRTLIWWKDHVMGRKEIVEPFVRACVNIRKYEFGNNRLSITFENLSAAAFDVELICDSNVYVSQAISLHPDTEIIMTADVLNSQSKSVPVSFRINNVWIADQKPLTIQYIFERN